MSLLENARVEIDKIDRQIVELYIKRMEAVNNVCKYKIENNMEVYQPEREIALLKKLDDLTPLDYKQDINNLYNLILKMSKTHQQRTIENYR